MLFSLSIKTKKLALSLSLCIGIETLAHFTGRRGYSRSLSASASFDNVGANT